MALTSIGDQLTPGTPSELTFAAEQGLPSAQQTICLIGHLASDASTGTSAYSVITMTNVADVAAASGEALTKFGNGELAEMVIEAVKANQASSTFPPIKCIPLQEGDSDWGDALTTLDRTPCEYVVGCYDGTDEDLTGELIDAATAMSSAQRVENGQYGTLAVVANQDVSDPSLLPAYDKACGTGAWLPDSDPTLSVGALAASHAAQLAANGVPFNPVKNKVLPNVPAPEDVTEWITVGAGMESEVALDKGWSPLRVLPNGDVAHLRARTFRITTGDGVTKVTSYFDVMDFNVLFFWRKTIVTRFNQSDVTQAKASSDEAILLLSEVIRLAQLFQTQGMFQNIDSLAKKFKVQRNSSDRSRFDVFTPVNVIPILAVVASNIQATTEGDTLTV